MKKYTPVPIAVLTADWHLTPNAWTWIPSLSGDALFGLQQIVETANEYSLSIIAAGDQFDTRRPKLEILVAAKSLIGNFRYIAGGYISGNHDRTQPDSWMDVIEGCWTNLEQTSLFISEPRCDAGGNVPPLEGTEPESPALKKAGTPWTAYGIPWVSTKAELQERLDALVSTVEESGEDGDGNVLVLHQSCSLITRLGEPELDNGMIPDCFDIVICGHFHKAGVFQIETKSGKLIPCVSPGGTHLLAVDEDITKKLYFLYDDGSIASKPLMTRRIIRLDMSDATEGEIWEAVVKVSKAVERKSSLRPVQLSTPIVSVKYNSSTAASVRTMFDTALGRENAKAHLFYKDVSAGTDGLDRLEYDDTDDSVSLETGFQYARDVFEKAEPDKGIRRIVESILDTEPSYEVYEQIKQSFLHPDLI